MYDEARSFGDTITRKQQIGSIEFFDYIKFMVFTACHEALIYATRDNISDADSNFFTLEQAETVLQHANDIAGSSHVFSMTDERYL